MPNQLSNPHKKAFPHRHVWWRLVIWPIVLLLCWGVWHLAKSTDEIITDGEAYGFTIAMTKPQAFQAAAKQFDGSDVFMMGIGGGKNSWFTKLQFTENNLATLSQQDTWTFFFEKSFLDSLQLEFSAGKLQRIVRHQQLFH